MRKAEENRKKKKRKAKTEQQTERQERTGGDRGGDRNNRAGHQIKGGAPQSWGNLLGSQRMALNSTSPAPKARLFSRSPAVPKTSWRWKQRGRFWGPDGLRAERPRVEIT